MVHVSHASHAELAAITFRQLAERSIEAPGTQKEACVQHLPITQLTAETLGGNARARTRIAEVRIDPFAIRRAHTTFGVFDVAPEDTVALQLQELGFGKARTDAHRGQTLENARVDSVGNCATG